ncbi:MAG: right-handed parallel beta-helix repeat-containing protein, partial [Actinobacteria bacterium]|nr:right-handed parallel beta-helix repeat-containing protein [Actinomycetota bacterium]
AMGPMSDCAGSPPNENNEIAHNTCNGNGTSGRGSGIKLFSTPNAAAPARNTITDNVCDNNTAMGISVESGGPGVGATQNTIMRNKAHGNAVYDAADANTPPCDANTWRDNDFGTVNHECVTGGQAPPPPPGELECGQEITADAVLQEDLVCTSGPALVVTADNITLDLNGHTISGTEAMASAGILLRGVSGVTVQNGTVERFGAGVVIEGGSNNTVRNVTARDNIGAVSGEYGDGIVLMDSSENLIQGNNVLHNGPFSGISLVGASKGNLVRGNIVEDNNMLHTGNPTAGRQDMGIRVEGPEANNNRVMDNTVSRSGAEGISLHATCSPTGTMSECDGSPPNENNEVVNNTCNGNGTSGRGSGIKLFSTPNAVAPARNTITDNACDNNTANGISVDSGGRGVGATQNTLMRNKAHGNAVYDAADGNTPPCDANTWSENDFGTVNHQCVRGGQAPPPPPPAGEFASIGPIELRVDVQDGEALVHVMYDINFSEVDVQSNQVYSEECRLIGVDVGVDDPPAAGADDTLGFLTPLFNDNTTPEGGSATLSRHFTKTFRRATVDEDKGSIPNPDELRARVTLTPR